MATTSIAFAGSRPYKGGLLLKVARPSVPSVAFDDLDPAPIWGVVAWVVSYVDVADVAVQQACNKASGISGRIRNRSDAAWSMSNS